MNIFLSIFQRRRPNGYQVLRDLDDRTLRDIGFERDMHGRVLGRDFARLQASGR